MAEPQVILSCEHGGNRVPAMYKRLFRSREARRALASHRGHDPGALELARLFASRLRVPLHASTITRLLVEPNRSLHHRALFSQFTGSLSAQDRRAIIERYYRPHRAAVQKAAARAIARRRIAVHLGIHTFTPILDGEVRSADIGILYDPRSRKESRLARRWQQALNAIAVLRVRRNYPYLGTADGLTTALRRRFGTDRYVGLELEVSQRFVAGQPRAWRTIQPLLIDSFQTALRSLNG